MATQPSSIEMFLPFIAIFVIFYFLIIRPQSKRMKEQEGFIGQLKRGDAVVTASGILGTIDGLTDQYVTLEIATGVKIKMLRKQITGSQAQLLEAAKAKDKTKDAETGKGK
jgi:preprotein translocase subunit YajC